MRDSKFLPTFSNSTDPAVFSYKHQVLLEKDNAIVKPRWFGLKRFKEVVSASLVWAFWNHL